tara:strand:+ start:1546 stop:1950 length:405 start_codon:yes stop_codon:yes gene_type:complete
MANAIYPNYKESLITGDANVSLSAGTVKVMLVDTGTYTYSAAHTMITDISVGSVANSAGLATKTVVDGLFDSDNVTFSAVTGASVEAIVLWVDSGTAAQSRVVAYIDTGVTGLPVTPNGGDITIGWNASGIFQL